MKAKLEILQASEMRPKTTSWIWDGWLAQGKLHLLAGAPGTGKTSIAVSLAAACSGGTPFPDGSMYPGGQVIFWSGEDDYEDAILPRFLACGGVPERLAFVGRSFDSAGRTRSFDPATDMQELAKYAIRMPRTALIIIDPIITMVTGDSHKNSEVRRSLQPLIDLAQDCGAAILGVTHFSKGTMGRDPTERVTGSVAFGALPRVVMATSKPKEAGASRRFVRTKSNIGPDGGGFEFQLERRRLAEDESIHAQAVSWGEPLHGTAQDLLAESPETDDGAGGPALTRAITWLEGTLKLGPIATMDILQQAAAAGHSEKTLRRAKEKLGIKPGRQPKGSVWQWELPKKPPPFQEEDDARWPNGQHGQHGQGGQYDQVGKVGSLEALAASLTVHSLLPRGAETPQHNLDPVDETEDCPF